MVKYPSVPKVPKAIGSFSCAALFFVLFEAAVNRCLLERGASFEKETSSGLETSSARLLDSMVLLVTWSLDPKLNSDPGKVP